MLFNPSVSWEQIPYLCFSTLLFCAICFTMCGVATNSGQAFFEFWIIFFEYAACITYFGIFLAMLTPTPQVHFHPFLHLIQFLLLCNQCCVVVSVGAKRNFFGNRQMFGLHNFLLFTHNIPFFIYYS